MLPAPNSSMGTKPLAHQPVGDTSHPDYNNQGWESKIREFGSEREQNEINFQETGVLPHLNKA